jgi:superkiller protein 3
VPAWLIVVVLLVVALGALFFLRTAEQPMPPGEIPDPDLTGMPVAVATALRDARQKVVRKIDSSEAWGNFGQLLDAYHLYDGALVAYEQAHELDPTYFPWAHLLAVLRDFQGADVEETVASFEAAMRINSIYPPTPYRYGEALLRHGRLPEARAAFQTAIDLDPDFSMAHRGLGHALIALGESETAVEHLERASEIEPSDGMIYSALARAYHMQGDRDRAKAAAEKAKVFSPVYAVPDPIRYDVEQLARTRPPSGTPPPGDPGDGNKIVAELRQEIERYRDDPAHRDDLGRSHGQLAFRLAITGDLDGAIAEFEAAAAILPDDPEVQHNLGTALMRRGDLELAVERFGRAIELNPDHPPTHYNLGWVLEKLGERDRAVEHYRLAVSVGPAPQPEAAARLAELGLE